MPPSAPPSEDGLTPQDVIMNYFDYSPAANGAKGGSDYSSNDDGLTPQEVILNYFDYPNGPAEDSRDWGRDRERDHGRDRDGGRDSYGAPPPIMAKRPSLSGSARNLCRRSKEAGKSTTISLNPSLSLSGRSGTPR